MAICNGNPSVRFTPQKTGIFQITCRATLPNGDWTENSCDVYVLI